MRKSITIFTIILSLGSYGQSVEQNAKDYIEKKYELAAVKLDSAQFANSLDSITINDVTALEIVITSTTGDFMADETHTIMDEDGWELPNNGNLTSTRKTNLINYRSDAQSGEGEFLYYTVKKTEEPSENYITGGKYTYQLTILVGDEYSLF